MEMFLKMVSAIISSIVGILTIIEKLSSLFKRKNDPSDAGKLADESSSGNQSCQ